MSQDSWKVVTSRHQPRTWCSIQVVRAQVSPIAHPKLGAYTLGLESQDTMPSIMLVRGAEHHRLTVGRQTIVICRALNFGGVSPPAPTRNWPCAGCTGEWALKWASPRKAPKGAHKEETNNVLVVELNGFCSFLQHDRSPQPGQKLLLAAGHRYCRIPSPALTNQLKGRAQDTNKKPAHRNIRYYYASC